MDQTVEHPTRIILSFPKIISARSDDARAGYKEDLASCGAICPVPSSGLRIRAYGHSRDRLAQPDGSDSCQAGWRLGLRLHSDLLPDCLPPIIIQADGALGLGDGAARLLQRAPKADLRAALFEAGLAFLAADAGSVMPHIGTEARVYLPAGPGAFACTVVAAATPDRERQFLYASARTWIESGMLGPDQTFLPRAAKADAAVAFKRWHWDGDGVVSFVGSQHDLKSKNFLENTNAR